MPETKLVWSQILTRLKLCYSENLYAMDGDRNRVNTSVASYLTKSSECYIRYPDIKAEQSLFLDDGVHLSPTGNDVFLNTIQGGIEFIIQNWKNSVTFPDIYMYNHA